MTDQVNPLIIALMFIVRCLVPLGIMLALSYILKKLGLIREPPPPPQDWNQNGDASSQGGLSHGKV